MTIASITRIGLLASATSFALLAADASEAAVRKLTWKEAVALAAEKNPDLKSAEASLDSSASQVKGTYSAFIPSLSADLGYSRAGERNWLTGSKVTEPGRFGATLGAEWNLFNGFADISRLEQSQTRSRLARSKVTAAKAKASADLKIAFASMLVSTRAVRLAEIIIERRKQNMDLIRLRYENGNENKGSLLLAGSYFEEAKLDLLKAKSQKETATAQLAKALGVDEGEGFEVAGELPLQAPPPESKFDGLIASAPGHEQSLLEEEVRRSEVSIVRGAYFPSLKLVGSTGRFGPEFFPQDEGWSVGVVLSFPLFGGGRDFYKVQAARADLFAASYAREAVDRQLLVQIREAYSNYVQAEARERLAQSFLEAARVRAEIARAKYNNGLMSFEDWDGIENELIGREKGLLESTLTRATAEANWEQILGKGALP